MINPEIVKEYGEEGESLIKELCSKLSSIELDSLYVVDHHSFAPRKIVPAMFTSTCDQDIVDKICIITMEHYSKIDPDLIVTCNKFYGEGMKVWLTT